MDFLKRAVRKGVSQGIGDAIGKAVSQAIEPKATELANKAAESIDSAAQSGQQTAERTSGLEGAFANLERSMSNYATEAAKNMKTCPSCGKTTDAEKKFCPDCGTKLPEQTIAEGAVCPSCGRQNTIGTKFCADCGTKLPAAVAEEEAAAAADASVLADWQNKLAAYPVWSCGGSRYTLEDYGGYYAFGAEFASYAAAAQAVKAYGELARQHGFHPAGQYPSEQHLYKKVDGVCYGIDLEHCFEGDSECPQIGFAVGEPSGGYDYVKPEPKKPTSLKDLFKL